MNGIGTLRKSISGFIAILAFSFAVPQVTESQVTGSEISFEHADLVKALKGAWWGVGQKDEYGNKTTVTKTSLENMGMYLDKETFGNKHPVVRIKSSLTAERDFARDDFVTALSFKSEISRLRVFEGTDGSVLIAGDLGTFLISVGITQDDINALNRKRLMLPPTATIEGSGTEIRIITQRTPAGDIPRSGYILTEGEAGSEGGGRRVYITIDGQEHPVKGREDWVWYERKGSSDGSEPSFRYWVYTGPNQEGAHLDDLRARLEAAGLTDDQITTIIHILIENEGRITSQDLAAKLKDEGFSDDDLRKLYIAIEAPRDVHEGDHVIIIRIGARDNQPTTDTMIISERRVGDPSSGGSYVIEIDRSTPSSRQGSSTIVINTGGSGSRSGGDFDAQLKASGFSDEEITAIMAAIKESGDEPTLSQILIRLEKGGADASTVENFRIFIKGPYTPQTSTRGSRRIEFRSGPSEREKPEAVEDGIGGWMLRVPKYNDAGEFEKYIYVAIIKDGDKFKTDAKDLDGVAFDEIWIFVPDDKDNKDGEFKGRWVLESEVGKPDEDEGSSKTEDEEAEDAIKTAEEFANLVIAYILQMHDGTEERVNIEPLPEADFLSALERARQEIADLLD